MIRVDGGTFQMGATSEQQEPGYNEKPVHEVTLSTYYIGETEVTQALWVSVMGSNPSEIKGSNLPVENVNWNDCQDFVRKLSQLTGKNFRLPTEAEWEYAARGGNKSRGYQYSGSNRINDVAWLWENSGNNRLSGSWDVNRVKVNNCRTHNVKTKQTNELGIYDMSGNVYEWCQDWKGSYSNGAQANPTGPSTGSSRVLRGGSWGNDAGFCRVASRYSYTPNFRCGYIGLRLAL